MEREGGVQEGRPVRKVLPTYFFCLVLSLFLFQSIFLSIFALGPQMFCYLRLGRWAGFSIPAFVFFITAFFSLPAGLGYVIQFGIPGIILSEAIVRGQRLEKGIMMAVAVAMVLALVAIGNYASTEGVAIREAVRGVVEQVMTESIAFNEKAGFSADQMKELKVLVPVLAEAVSNLYPSIMVVVFLVTLWLNIMLVARVLKHMSGSAPFGELAKWRAPEHLVWGVVLSGFAMFAGLDVLKIAGSNLMIVLFVIYFFQGMAIISFYFRKRAVPGLLKGFGYFVVIRYMSVVVAFIGLFDIWVDFRKISQPKLKGS